jgi:rubrerythrin
MDISSTSPPVGASEWEVELYTALTSHVEKERAILEEYVEAANSTDSKALAYLVGLLIEDEKRHHRMFLDLAASLKTSAELRREDPIVPFLDFDRRNAGGVLDVTERLLQNEQDDAHELKRLHKMLREVKDASLWSLLVELMQRDTEKHIAMLKFAHRQASR